MYICIIMYLYGVSRCLKFLTIIANAIQQECPAKLRGNMWGVSEPIKPSREAHEMLAWYLCPPLAQPDRRKSQVVFSKSSGAQLVLLPIRWLCPCFGRDFDARVLASAVVPWKAMPGAICHGPTSVPTLLSNRYCSSSRLPLCDSGIKSPT